MLNAASKLKGEKDWMKYETARKLHKRIRRIRENYREDWKSKEMKIRQRAVALYFIDKVCHRVNCSLYWVGPACAKLTEATRLCNTAATLFHRQIVCRSTHTQHIRRQELCLPAHLRDEDITYNSFRRELKTFCFNVASGVQCDFC